MKRKNEGPTRQDWVIKGLNTLAAEGIDAVKIERLAAKLKVSKAPFYWRFKDRSELLQAMLDYWAKEMTTDLIREVASHSDPRKRLEALIYLSLEEDSNGVLVSGVEGAIRAWAAQESTVATFVTEVDGSRIKYVVKELKALGANGRTATLLSKGIYLTLIGLYSARRYTPTLASDQAFVAVVNGILDDLTRSKN